MSDEGLNMTVSATCALDNQSDSHPVQEEKRGDHAVKREPISIFKIFFDNFLDNLDFLGLEHVLVMTCGLRFL